MAITAVPTTRTPAAPRRDEQSREELEILGLVPMSRDAPSSGYRALVMMEIYALCPGFWNTVIGGLGLLTVWKSTH